MNKAEAKAKDFLKYVQEHPSERFWQALQNFIGMGYIYTSPEPLEGMKDTYYLD